MPPTHPNPDHLSPVRIDLATVLERTALLSSLSRAEFQSLALRTVRKHFKTGELLFSEDDPCHGLHIIAGGKIRIFKTSVTVASRSWQSTRPASPLPSSRSSMEAAYPASAMAIEDSEIAFISRHDFQAFCMEHPEVAIKLLAVVGGRLRRLVGIIEELSFTTIRQRLIALLLRLAETEGKQTPQGIEFQLPVSHQELASQLGTVRELVSRNLMRLQAEGLLDVDARQIVVKDKAGLSAPLLLPRRDQPQWSKFSAFGTSCI